jgi:uncharacterized membrane protein
MSQRNAEPDRMDFLTDGVFAIVATLLVLEVKVPKIPEPHGRAELVAALLHVVPSLVAFAFGFLTVAIYWLNHDRISRLVTHYDDRSRYLNLLMLFFICLIPFVTAFIAEYPFERAAVVAYGVVMLACAAVSNWTFRYLAFTSGLLAGTTHESRRRLARTILGGPLLYAVAVAAAFVAVPVALALFLATPLLYVVLPKVTLEPVPSRSDADR